MTVPLPIPCLDYHRAGHPAAFSQGQPDVCPFCLAQALAEEWCNGCKLPRHQWGPVCPGMTQGDWTHYHSPEWWRAQLEVRPA